MRTPLIVTLASISVFAVAGAPSKAAFQKEYDKLSRAFERKDEKAYFSILAPDFHQEMKGKPPMTAKEIKADFKHQMDSMSDMHWTRTVLSATPAKDGYDVKVSGHLIGMIRGQDGKLHQLVVDGRTLDHWNRGMQIEVAKVISLDMTYDGKKMQMGG